MARGGMGWRERAPRLAEPQAPRPLSPRPPLFPQPLLRPPLLQAASGGAPAAATLLQPLSFAQSAAAGGLGAAAMEPAARHFCVRRLVWGGEAVGGRTGRTGPQREAPGM